MSENKKSFVCSVCGGIKNMSEVSTIATDLCRYCEDSARKAAREISWDYHIDISGIPFSTFVDLWDCVCSHELSGESVADINVTRTYLLNSIADLLTSDQCACKLMSTIRCPVCGEYGVQLSEHYDGWWEAKTECGHFSAADYEPYLAVGQINKQIKEVEMNKDYVDDAEMIEEDTQVWKAVRKLAHGVR